MQRNAQIHSIHKKNGNLLGVLLAITLAVAFSGCAMFQSKEEKSARELAEEGMEALREEKAKAAVESFQKLRDWYPFSQYAVLAELKLGDAHYMRGEYEEAIFAYEEFENLHPKNEAVPYVVYQIGRCYFDRLDTIDRDQTVAKEAIRVFERLMNDHPASPYVKKAQQHIRACKKSLAEHDFYVGRFYFKSKHYKAAAERFKSVMTDYPDFGVHYQALQYLTLCHNEMKKSSVDSE